MEDQRRLLALVAAKAAGPAVALLESGSLRQIRRDLSRLHLGHIPGHHFAAPDVDHQVEVQPHATHTCGQVGDVPAPYLIRPPWPRALAPRGVLVVDGLARGGEPDRGHGAADRSCALNRSRRLLRRSCKRPDRPGPARSARRQCHEIALVAGEQDPTSESTR